MTIGSLFLAVQGASSPRIGPTESRPRHGKGILKRVRRRNILTAIAKVRFRPEPGSRRFFGLRAELGSAPVSFTWQIPSHKGT